MKLRNPSGVNVYKSDDRQDESDLSHDRVKLDLHPKYFRQPRSLTSWVREWVLLLLGALLVALVLKTYVVQIFWIPSPSMEQTLVRGDRVLVSRFVDKASEVNRGDVVVFDRPPSLQGEEEIKDLIKRVVAVPGDRVVARSGVLYVNDVAVSEPYVYPAGVSTDWPNTGPVTLGPGQLFVMGDNRKNSTDSRVFGPIDEDLLVGRAFLRFWPFDRFGTI